MTLIDVRDTNEHTGKDSTACCTRRGCIPGSVWIEWTEFLSGGRFKEPGAVRALLVDRGVNPFRIAIAARAQQMPITRSVTRD